ncbi:MAG: NAD(P)-binding protein [Actinomycetota bacterium]
MNERNIALRRALIKAVVAIAVVVGLATVALSLREDILLPQAFLLVILMLGSNTSMLDLAALQTDTQVMVTVILLLRVLIMALAAATILDFILRQRLPMLYTRRSKRMQNHVILCGLGQVGYRTALELQKFDTEITVIELDSSGQFVNLITDRGIPILFEDARNSDVLVKAGVERAAAVIACTDNDLSNVEIALDAREINPNIRVVLRLFDQRLASKIRNSFDIEAAFSASALAAPAFAAAAVDPSVEDSFYVGDVLFVYAGFWVPEGSTLTKRTVWDLWGEYDVNTLSFTSASGEITRHSGPTITVPPNARVAVVGPYDQVQRLQADHGIIDPSERVRHNAASSE